MSLPDQVIGWLTLASHVVSTAAAISAITPSPKTTGALNMAYKILQILALNIGQAANAKDQAPSPNTP